MKVIEINDSKNILLYIKNSREGEQKWLENIVKKGIIWEWLVKSI